MDHDELLPRDEAVSRVRSHRETALDRLTTERVGLDAIRGRVLAERIDAEADLPSHDHATMDGFAFDATDDYPLTVVGEVFPEDEPPVLEPGEAVRIATGAPLPEAANAVLRREDADASDGELRGTEIAVGTYRYARGSNVSAGETLFEPGERLLPKDAVLLRDVGVETVRVRNRLSAAVLATGTEIHEGTSADLDSPMLAGLVDSWGGTASLAGTVPDDYDRVERRIDELAREHDVVITTGGTSVGRKDYVVRALDALGAVDFHGVRVRPGRPVAVADLPDHEAIAFAIPGKPVGAHTVSTVVMRPFFTGEGSFPGIDATLARDVEVGRGGFEYAVPVVLDDGEAMPLGHVDSSLPVYDGTFNSSVISSSTRATRADGFFLLDTDVAAGDTVSVVPYGVVE